MARKRKTRKKEPEPEKERYKIQVEDWDVYYDFGLNIAPKDLIPGLFWEISKLTLTGKILSPVLKAASKAKVEIAARPQLDDHWTAEPTVASAKAIGWMEIPRGFDTLMFYCSIPSRSFQYVPVSVSAGKVKYASIFGTKLKWRKGTVSGVTLSTVLDE
jgi:hypothetical protein